MRTIERVGAPLLLIICVCNLNLATADEHLRARFETEASRDWKKIVALSTHLEMKIVDRRISNGEEVLRVDWENKFAGENCLVIRSSVDKNGVVGNQDVMCRGPKYSFDLNRPAPTGTWSIRHVGAARSSQVEKLGTSGADTPQLYIANSYLPDMIGSSGFTIASVESTDRGPEKLVSVAFKYSNPENAKAVWTLRGGVVRLNPARLWAIQEYEIECHNERNNTIQQWSQKNEFQSAPENSPLLRRREQIRQTGPGTTDNMIWEFVEIRQRDIPEKEFMLTAFGLPEIGPPALSARSRLWMWLVGAGIACVVIAVVIRRRSKES